jgi:hypothetical protein
MSNINLTTPNLRLRNWVNDLSRPYHLTINDILSVPIGETVRLIPLEPNLSLSILNKVNKRKKYKPSLFFKDGYFIDFTRQNQLSGEWRWFYCNTLQDTEPSRDFYIDIGKSWYPLVSSRIPLVDLRDFFIIPKQIGGKHVYEIDKHTRIGWRGPIIMQKYIDKCPYIDLF